MRNATLTCIFLYGLSPAMTFAEDVELPKDAEQVLVQNGWQVLAGQELVPGTEMLRARRYHHTYYAARLGDGRGRVVFEEPNASYPGFRPLRIGEDGTVAAAVVGVEADNLLIVGPDDPAGKRGDGVAVPLPDPQPDAPTMILHANASGLVAYPRPRNPTGKFVPVYFVPLEGREPRPGRAVALVERAASDILPSRSGFHVSDGWIVWPRGSYEVATGTIRERPAARGRTTVLGLDGDRIVEEVDATIDGEPTHEIVATDLKTGAVIGRRPITSNGRVLALHDGVVYTLTVVDTRFGERGPRSDLAAFDIDRPDVDLLSRVIIRRPRTTPSVLFTAGGFTIVGVEDGDVPWVARQE